MKKELAAFLGGRPINEPITGDSSPRLTLKNFSKRYGTNKHYSVKDASFDVHGGEVFGFLEHVYGVVDPHVETYSKRGFTSLMVSFGCTGGQHRSVYCAEHMARHLEEKYPDIVVHLSHREQ